MSSIPYCLRLAACASLAFVLVQNGSSQTTNKAAKESWSFSLKKALAPATPCALSPRPIQFLSETTILVVSGPADCFHPETQIAVNVISIDGHLLARKPWPSTGPGVVVAAERLVLVGASSVEVDGPDLNAIQSLELPPHHSYPRILHSDQQGAITLSIDGKDYSVGGSPLALLAQPELDQEGARKEVFSFSDSQVIVQEDDVLKVAGKGHPSRTIASLQWVMPPCGAYTYCQMYDAGSSIQVSTGRKRRVLVYSNGSKFPISDAAGLFPYFRLQVFDFDSGAELYREERITRTGSRSAVISPDGSRLATTDGDKVVVHNLP